MRDLMTRCHRPGTILAASLFLATATASCASSPTGGARGPGATAEVSERLFFGQAIPGGGSVSTEEWAAFLRDVVTPRFPSGLTVWNSEGQWQEASGQTVREAVIVLEVIHLPGPDLEAFLDEISTEYKRRFRQEAVLRVTSTVRSRMYE